MPDLQYSKPAFLYLVNVATRDWHGCIEQHHKVVGRGIEANIRLPAQYISVSRRHVEVWCTPTETWLMDLNSSGGTKIDGIRLKPKTPVRIAPGDRLSLANVELRLSALPPPNDRWRSLEASVPSEMEDSHPDLELEHLDRELRELIGTLTPAEFHVLLWIRRGLDRDEDLARQLHRSEHTIRAQVASIFQKLNVHTRSGLLSLFHRADAHCDAH